MPIVKVYRLRAIVRSTGPPPGAQSEEPLIRLRRPFRAWLVAALVVSGGVEAVATTPVPYGPRVQEAVASAFFEDGRPSPEKIEGWRRWVGERLAFIQAHVADDRRIRGGEKKKRARRKAADTDSAFTLRYELELLDRLEAAPDPVAATHLGATILTLDFTPRSYQYPLASIQMPIYIGQMLVDWSADAHTRPGDGPSEASNLVAGVDEFYTAEELDALIADGVDISRIQPPGDGRLWRPTGIEGLDVADHYLGGGHALHEGRPSVFPPDGAHFELKKIRLTQTKPKIDARWYDDACRARSAEEQKDCGHLYKLKFGAESHSDPVVNALMSAVGYNSDVSLHTKRPRVYLGDTTYGEFARDWANYFDVQHLWTRLPLADALLPGDAGHGRDERGEYLVFRAAGIELKPEEFRRIGPYSNGLIQDSAIARDMREARGLFLFNVWVANTDLKDAENNKVVMRAGPDGDWRLYMSQQDTGNALGLILAEKVDAFPWDAIETSPWSRAFGAMRGRIELNYFALQQTGLYRTATHADHRWMARRIARLSRQQIADAVALGRFPGGVGALYVEKLASRRNQLVEAFGLADEFTPLPIDRKLTTDDGSVVNGRAVVTSFPEETPVDLGDHWASLMRPMGPALWRQVRRLVAVGVSAIDAIGAEVPIEGDLTLYPELLINLSRDVVPNPSPRNQLDQYIVEDALTIGVRVGIGAGAQGRIAVQRRYRLAYTAPSDWEAKLYGNQALNWFLPMRARRGELPERFTLLRADELSPGFVVRSPDPVAVIPGVDLAIDGVFSKRIAIDRRPEGAVVWADGGPAVRSEGRFWFKLFVMRFSLVRFEAEAGDLAGDLFVLDANDADSEALVEAAVSAALMGDVEPARELGKAGARHTEIDYLSVWRQINLFWAKWKYRDRREWIGLASAGGNPIGEQFQVARQRSFSWRFLDNGESITCHVEGFLDPRFAFDGNADVDPAPVIVASYLIDDKNTWSDELDAYHRFLQGLGGGKRPLAKGFRAADWEQTGQGGRWGRLLVEGQLALRGEALDALTNLDEARFWKKLAKRLDVEDPELERAMRELSDRNGSTRMGAWRRMPMRLRTSLGAARRALRAFEEARETEDPEERLSELSRGIYQASYSTDGSFQAPVLDALLRSIGFEDHAERGNGSVRVRIGTAVENENKLPERRDFVGRVGTERVGALLDVIAEPFDSVEAYHMLDWARGEPKTDFIAPDVLR